VLSNFLSDTISIYRPTVTYNSIGEIQKSLVLLFENVVCSFQQKTGSNSIIENVNGIRKNIRIYLNIISITENDIIRYNGKDYTIIAIANMYDNHLQVDCEI
jgi:hypothetical protein